MSHLVNGQQKVTGPNEQKVFTVSCFKLWNLSCNWVPLTCDNTMGQKSNKLRNWIYDCLDKKWWVRTGRKQGLHGQKASTTPYSTSQQNLFKRLNRLLEPILGSPHWLTILELADSRVTALMDDNPIYVFLNKPYISAHPVADILTIMLTKC